MTDGVFDIHDEAFDLEEAAKFCRVSPGLLDRGHAPVAVILTSPDAQKGRKVYLKSQLIRWLLSRHVRLIDPAQSAVTPKLRQVR